MTGYATMYLNHYYNRQDEHIQDGFQVTLRTQLGYRFELFHHRVFLEPSIETSYWPVNTNMPPRFRAIDAKEPNYILFGPNLYFGATF